MLVKDIATDLVPEQPALDAVVNCLVPIALTHVQTCLYVYGR